MRKIVVKEWMTLDGVFDADTMDQWWNPYDSAEGQKYILEGYSRGDVYLLGRTTYEMLWPFWSTQTNDDNGPGRILNRMKKYVVSTTRMSPTVRPAGASSLRRNCSPSVTRAIRGVDTQRIICGRRK